MKFKGAIFDMDGTLVDSLGVWEVIWERMGQAFGLGPGFRPAPEDDKKVRTMLMIEAMELIHQKYHMGKSGQELLDFGNAVTVRFYRDELEPKAGVLNYLAYLKEQGVPMCVASATAPDLVQVAVKRCGIDRYIDTFISCADVGKGKEEPDVFLEALKHLGTPKEETCVFEDSYVALKTASDAGFLTVGIHDPHTFDHDKLEKAATVYIAEGETLERLIK